MALKTLCSVLPSLSISIPHHWSPFNLKFSQLDTKPSLIICEFSKSPTQASRKPASSDAHFTDYGPVEPEGTGAAAPTPGERHLEHQKSVEALKLVLKENKKERKKQKREKLVMKASLAVASCYGCGAPLQTSEIDGPGYVDLKTYELVGFSWFQPFRTNILTFADLPDPRYTGYDGLIEHNSGFSHGPESYSS